MFLARDQTAAGQPSGLMAVYLPINGVCMFLMFSTRARNRGLLLYALFRALDVLGVLGVCYLTCFAPSPGEPPRIGWFEPNLRRFGPCLRCGNSRSRPSWKITKEAQPSRGFLAGRCDRLAQASQRCRRSSPALVPSQKCWVSGVGFGFARAGSAMTECFLPKSFQS